MKEQPLTRLVTTLLEDDNGISEKHYNELFDFLEGVPGSEDREQAMHLLRIADAVDGRFFLPD